MVDIKETIVEVFPITDTSTFVFNLVTFFVLVIAFGILAGVITYLIVRRKKFNKKIVIFEKIAGRFEPAKKDRAMEVKLEKTGDTTFYLAKAKKYLPTPTIQTGRNTYWFAVREDGEWINIGIEDIDVKMREVQAHFLDKEMRYSRVALQRSLQERYDKPGFWAKYGGLIAYISLILVTGIMVWLLFDKFIEIAGQVANVVKSADAVMEVSERVVGALDNICAGSGIRAA